MRIIKNIEMSGIPDIKVRPVTFSDNKEVITEKQKKQFIALLPLTLKVNFFGKYQSIIISSPHYYMYDGATIPFGLGKGDMKILLPALFHDIMCENHSIVDNCRFLSSRIFFRCLLKCKNNFFKALFMSLVVDIFQMFFCHWRKSE